MTLQGEEATSQSPGRAGGTRRPEGSTTGAVPVWLGTLAGISWRLVAVVALLVVPLAIAILLMTVTVTLLVAGGDRRNVAIGAAALRPNA